MQIYQTWLCLSLWIYVTYKAVQKVTAEQNANDYPWRKHIALNVLAVQPSWQVVSVNAKATTLLI